MMTHEDARKYQENLMAKALAIVENKRHDYSGGEDPFRNFRTSEAITGVETWRGIMVRLGDKLSRIRSVMESGEYRVRDETIEDTLADIINYTCILGGIIKEEQDNGR